MKMPDNNLDGCAFKARPECLQNSSRGFCRMAAGTLYLPHGHISNPFCHSKFAQSLFLKDTPSLLPHMAPGKDILHCVYFCSHDIGLSLPVQQKNKRPKEHVVLIYALIHEQDRIDGALGHLYTVFKLS